MQLKAYLPLLLISALCRADEISGVVLDEKGSPVPVLHATYAFRGNENGFPTRA